MIQSTGSMSIKAADYFGNRREVPFVDLQRQIQTLQDELQVAMWGV